MAAAVKDLYSETTTPHLTLGPAIDTGFYYDIDFRDGAKPTEADLARIEKKMKELLSSWKEFEKEEKSPEEAKELVGDNPYKKEIIEETE